MRGVGPRLLFFLFKTCSPLDVYLDVYLFKYFIYSFFERGREGEREGENINVWLPLAHLLLGAPPGPQPRHVLWLVSKLVILWFIGQRSVHWATPTRAELYIFLKATLLICHVFFWSPSSSCFLNSFNHLPPFSHLQSAFILANLQIFVFLSSPVTSSLPNPKAVFQLFILSLFMMMYWFYPLLQFSLSLASADIVLSGFSSGLYLFLLWHEESHFSLLDLRFFINKMGFKQENIQSPLHI